MEVHATYLVIRAGLTLTRFPEDKETDLNDGVIKNVNFTGATALVIFPGIVVIILL